MKTQLGEINEKAILNELDPIIKKWATKLRLEIEDLEGSVSYLWEDRRREEAQRHDDWLSANEIGPYGGR